MTAASRATFVSLVISHAAQLAYVEDSRGAYELLSRTDRLLRYLDGRNPRVSAAAEVDALLLYAEVLNLCAPHSVELVLGSLDSEALRDETVFRGALLESLAACMEDRAKCEADYALSGGSLIVTVVPAPLSLSTRTTGTP